MQVGLTWLKFGINIIDKQFNGRRISNKNLLISETTAFQNYRNENKFKIHWNFTKENADEKLSKYYI